MDTITHYYSLSPQWQHDFTRKIGAELIDRKIMIIPKYYGSGYMYFTEVLPGISILFKDYVFNVPLALNKLASMEEFYILDYNPTDYKFSELENDLNYEVNDFINLDLSISINQMENISNPMLNKRIFGLSLFIDKEVMHNYIKELPNSEFLSKKLNIDNCYYYDYIDSKSLILLLSIKKKSVFDISFEYFMKGTALSILANFLDRRFDIIPVKKDISCSE